MQYAFRLLGTPQIFHDGEWLHLPKNQLTLLAAYLAVSEGWVSRDELIFVFWPDMTEAKGRRNLNQLAYQLKNLAWASDLESNATHLRFNISTDLQLFQIAIADSDWSEAIRLYKFEFLTGSFRNVSANFEAWLEVERHNLEMGWKDATLNYVNELDVKGEYDYVLKLLDSILRRDSLDEEVIQLYLDVASKANQVPQALRIFEIFQNELAAELDLAPSDETLRLVAKIKSDSTSKITQAKSSLEISVSEVQNFIPKYNVPQFASGFVGRESELAELATFFSQVDCRLVTILGWGGMGKTRLAVKAMLEHSKLFKDGVAFIPLSFLSNETDIVQEIVRVLELDFRKGTNEKQQLISYFVDKEMLLLFDNFEHLLDYSDIVSEFLQASTSLRILATSREALNFQGEQLLELQGLDQPEHVDESDFEQNDSVKLFLRTARRTDSYKYSLKDRPILLKIFQFLEGMPLAIELAAQWLRLLSLPEILIELERDLDFLESQEQDRPDRQQSMRQVFKYSWQLLSESDQDAMMKLAILQGAFPRKAAQAITGISLQSLLSLINKSVIKQQNGLLTRHPLMYEFTLEKLQNTDEYESLQEQHSEYYKGVARALKGEPVQAFVGLQISHENLVATMSYLSVSQPKDALYFLLNLAPYWELRAYYKEISIRLKELLVIYNRPDELRAKACLLLAKHGLWQSLWAESQQALGESVDLAEQLDLLKVKADALHSLGNLNFYQSQYSEAKMYYEQSIALYRELNDDTGVAQTLTSMGVIAKDQGNYDLANSYYQDSLDIRKQLQDQYGIATALNNLGVIAKDQGKYNRAFDLYNQSLLIREELHDERGIAQCLLNIGLIEVNQKSYEEAKKHLERSLGIERKIGNVYGTSLCLNTLANLAVDQRQYEEAEKLLMEGLKLKEQLGDQRGIAFSMHSLAFLRREQDNYVSAAKSFKQSLNIFQSILDQRGCLLVIADSITLFTLTENPKSFSFYQRCQTLCHDLNISLAPRTWNKTQKSIEVFKEQQFRGRLSSHVTLNDLIGDCESELELLSKSK